MPVFGATVRLTLRGGYHLLAAPLEERAIECDLTVDLSGVRGTFLRREGRVVGRVTAEGLATDRVIEGRVRLRTTHGGQLLLTLDLGGDDGERYTLRGYVEVLPVAPITTATEVPFCLYDASGREIGRGLLRFDVRGELGRALRSVRVRVGAA